MSRALIRRSPATHGRDPELARIRDAITAARSGRGGCLALIGEAGYGKTRLLVEAAALAAAERMTVLAGSAPNALSPPPYGAIAPAFRGWLRTERPPVEDLRPFAAGLRRFLPEWPDPGPVADPGAAQMRLLVPEAAVRLTLAAARPYGAALILDDLHDADPETVEIVHHVAGSVTDEPVLLLVAMRPGRPGPAEPEIRGLVQRGLATIADVGPLDRAAIAVLVGSLLGTPAPTGLIEEIASRTDGSPLLVEELLDAYVSSGYVVAADDGIQWTPASRPLVPPTLVQSVRRKLASLPDEARRMIGAAAVLGGFDPDILVAVADLQPSRLADATDEAVDAGLLVASDRVEFRHALIMDAAVEALVPMRRSELHRRAAEALARRYPNDRFEARAHHLEAAGRTADAARMLLAAAERSLESYAPASAETVLRKALSLEPGPELEATARDWLAQALSALGRWEEALRLDVGNPASRDNPTRLMRMAGNALRSGRLDEADELIGRSAALGGKPGPVSALAGLVALWRGEYERALSLASRALEHGEQAGDSAVVCDALDVTGRAKDALGRRDEAVADFRRWEAEADRHGMIASRIQALMEAANVEYMRDASPATLREVRTQARETGTLTTLVLADLSLTWCLGSAAHLGEAIDCATEATDYCRRFGLDLLPHALNALAWAMGRREPHSGDALCDEAIAVAPKDGDVAVCAREIRGDSLLRAGRFEEAADHLERGWSLIRDGDAQLPAMTPFLFASALAAAGHSQDAAAALAVIRDHPSRWIVSVNGFWLDVAEALTSGDARAMSRVLSPERTPAALERAIAAIIAADVLPSPNAPSWARNALAVFESAGAEADAARARSLLRRHGAPVPRARRNAAAVPSDLREKGVTLREAEVLELVGKGLSNAEIARTLSLSVRTVESHVSSLLSKLAVEGRPGLIALALGAPPR